MKKVRTERSLFTKMWSMVGTGLSVCITNSHPFLPFSKWIPPRLLYLFLGLAIGLGSTQYLFEKEALAAWSTKANMPTARRGLAAVALNGMIYVIGGIDDNDPADPNDNTYYGVVERYDPAKNTWAVMAPMNTPRCWLVAKTVNGKIYAIGGNNGVAKLGTVEEYNPATDTWTPKASMPSPRDDSVAGVVNGKIYVIGGWLGGNEALDNVEEYDPATDSWSTKQAMIEGRALAAGTGLNGKIYVMGGLFSGSDLAQNYRYEPAADFWSMRTDMPTARSRAAASVVDDEIYVIGGYNKNVVERYDPSTNLWETVTPMLTQRGDIAAAVVNDVVYVFGGRLDFNQPVLSVTEAGECMSDRDSDGDGTPDCLDSNDDNDGLPDVEEQGPDGNDPDYDGNGDGVADSLQDNVVSFHTYANQDYITMESPPGTSIINCTAEDNPSINDAPSDVEFSYGFIGFTIDGVAVSAAITITLYFPAGETFNTYYKYGPTPIDITNHWYEFLYDGQTGAEISGNVITLHFVDGMRGDDDLIANGSISDLGGPGMYPTPIGSGGSGGQPAISSNGGGGGCFIASAAYGSRMAKEVKILKNFRDDVLIENAVGTVLVKAYYWVSPPVADFIAKHEILKMLVRWGLLPIVGISWITLTLGLAPIAAFLVLLLSFAVWIYVFCKRKAHYSTL